MGGRSGTGPHDTGRVATPRWVPARRRARGWHGSRRRHGSGWRHGRAWPRRGGGFGGFGRFGRYGARPRSRRPILARLGSGPPSPPAEGHARIDHLRRGTPAALRAGLGWWRLVRPVERHLLDNQPARVRGPAQARARVPGPCPSCHARHDRGVRGIRIARRARRRITGVRCTGRGPGWRRDPARDWRASDHREDTRDARRPASYGAGGVWPPKLVAPGPGTGECRGLGIAGPPGAGTPRSGWSRAVGPPAAPRFSAAPGCAVGPRTAPGCAGGPRTAPGCAGGPRTACGRPAEACRGAARHRAASRRPASVDASIPGAGPSRTMNT